jgi:hypothetical protein
VTELEHEAFLAAERGDFDGWLALQLRMGWLGDGQADELRAALAAKLEAA